MMDNKKTLSIITAGVMSLAMCGTLVSSDLLNTAETVEAVSEQSAIDIVNDMGSGWNLGNTFDSAGITWKDVTTPSDVETAWGNVATTKDMISAIHDYGFETVRIPVTWYQMTDEDYNIDEAYIERIKEVVDWCQEEGMYAIINMHWDQSYWLNDSSDNSLSFDEVEKKYTTMWTQIADAFSDYDNKLVFESNNEPTLSVSNLMTLNQDFVDVVRSSDGNNANRLLLISSPSANMDSACSSDFQLPTDPANMEAVSVHSYDPTVFCVYPSTDNWGGLAHQTTWGTSSDITTLYNYYEKLKSTYIDNGVPVIIGEYGVITNDDKDDDSIKAYLKAVASYANSCDGMASILWDSGNGGDMQYFDRVNLTFFDSEIGDMYKELNNATASEITYDWVETEITEDSKGTIAVNTNGATKFKVEATATPYASGSGVIGYWDNTLSKWIGDQVYFTFSTDEDGNVTFSQTDSDYKTVLHQGFFEIPETADTTSFQVQVYYSAYWDSATEDMVECDKPVLTNAYMWGVSTSADTETTTTTTEATVTTTEDKVTTTEEAPATTTEATEGSSSASGELAEPDFVNLFGYVYPSFTNGVVSQWSIDGSDSSDTLPLLAEPVAITGNGDYTLTINIPADGAAETILFLALDSTLNSYQQNADEEEILSDITWDVTSILVDGVEIQYVADAKSLAVGNDGACWRKTIYSDWSKPGIYDINASVVNTQSIVVNFTIGGIVGGDNQTTEVTTTTDDTQEPDVTTTTDDTVEPDVTTTTDDTQEPDVVPSTGIKGDVNGDGEILANDLLLIKKSILGIVTLEGESAENADVNGDGEILANDLLLVKKYILGIVESIG
jgi:endoglucanase